MSDKIAAGVPTVQVIMGSIRAGRLCPKLAAWVIDIGRPV
jgi:NAD(P)H-dependent FMN reductase